MLTLCLQYYCLLQQHPRLHGSLCLGRRPKGRGPLCSPTEWRLLYSHVIVYEDGMRQ